MANIACAWELGGGLGHAHALSILGSYLEASSHTLSYILKDKNAISHFLKTDECSVFTAVVRKKPYLLP